MKMVRKKQTGHGKMKEYIPIISINNEIYMKDKVIVLGGCHVTGYPYSSADSFVYKLHKFSDFDIFIEGNVTIKKLNNGLKLSNDNKYILLQLGHYETSFTLREYLLGRRKRRLVGERESVSSISSNSLTITDGINNIGFKFFLNDFLKYGLKIIREIFSRSLLDEKNIHSNLNQFFTNLKELNIKNVIVLSSFYSASIPTNSYRKRYNEILSNITLKYGYQYIDVFNHLRVNTKKNNYYYSDAIHLTKNSIELLSNFINSVLK